VSGIRLVLLLGAGAACAAALGGSDSSAAPARRGPVVKQMVVFRSGKALTKRVRSVATRVRVEGRRCGVAKATPLAALVRSHPGRIGLEDFGRCTRRPRDSGQVYARSIRRDREAGRGGWVYKVGKRLATAGAADVAGPFGRGRLRRGQSVTWFYCVLRKGTCQRTLGLAADVAADGSVSVRVRSYDDEARGRLVEGATVTGGGASAVTGPAGRARLRLAAGRHTLVARKKGLIRSFGERVSVP